MKHLGSHWFLIGLVFLFLISCSPSGSDRMRLSTWVSSPSETAIFEKSLDDFREKYPDVDFKFEPIPGNYSEKIQLMLGTNTAPDLFFLKVSGHPPKNSKNTQKYPKFSRALRARTK